MRVHVVSDVHGNADALARAGDGADALVVLGDLLNYLDYGDPSQGIIADLLGPDAGQVFADLRKEHRFADLREYGGRLLAEIPDPAGAVAAAARRQYAALFAVLPAPAFCTFGNVDMPTIWRDVPAAPRLLDAEVVEIGGLRFGFVGGWPRRPVPPARTAAAAAWPAVHFGADVTEEEYAAKVAAVGAVDVLCSHVPPAVPELRWDTVSRAFEVASPALLDAIRETAPRYALFGHVHQPLQARMRIGRTECVNVGFFRRTARPFVLSWDGDGASRR